MTLTPICSSFGVDPCLRLDEGAPADVGPEERHEVGGVLRHHCNGSELVGEKLQCTGDRNISELCPLYLQLNLLLA